MAALPANANQLNAVACVLGVLISAVIVRIVTVLPEKRPERHRNMIICQGVLESPKSVDVMLRPNIDITRMPFRPR